MDIQRRPAFFAGAVPAQHGSQRGQRIIASGSGQRREVVIARIHDAFGIKGQVKARSYTDPPDNLLQHRSWTVVQADGTRRQFEVDHARRSGKFIAAALKGIEDRDQALELKGCDVSIPAENLEPLGEDEWYWSDLIGLTVRDASGKTMGTVKKLMETGANDVLVVEGESEILIPYIPQVIRNVDVEQGVILVDWNPDY